MSDGQQIRVEWQPEVPAGPSGLTLKSLVAPVGTRSHGATRESPKRGQMVR